VTYTETPPPLHDRPLEDRILETRAALARLQASIASNCPGPHEYVRHRSDKPPYCKACQVLDNGLPLSIYSASHRED
jgi:hypothetical protein